MDFSEILQRRTIRFFEQRPVPESAFRQLIDAARRASCGANTQQLRYQVIRDPELVAAIFPFTAYAARVKPGRDPIPGKTAPPAFIAVLAWMIFFYNRSGFYADIALFVNILFIFGKGPIQGFATTMMIGIITSVITSIFISRMLIDRDVKRGRPLRVYTSLSKNFFANTNFQFIQKKNLFYGVSLVLIVVSFLAMGIRGFDKSIDFVGGRTYTVRFDQPVVTAEVAKSLQEVLVEDGQHELPEVKTFGTDRQVKISTKFMSQKTGHDVDDMVDRTMYEGLKKFFPEGFTYEEDLEAMRKLL